MEKKNKKTSNTKSTTKKSTTAKTTTRKKTTPQKKVVTTTNTTSKRRKKKKINYFKVIMATLKTGLVLFLVSFALVVCLQRFSNNSISIMEYRMFSVATGSMVPKYQIGDVILCKEVDTNTLKIGDDITYIGKAGTFKDKTVTHRIIDIKTNNTGEKSFYTKGIASTRIDPVVKKDQIYGKIVKRFNFLSWLYKFVTTPDGFYMCIFIPLTILVGSEIVTSMVEKYEDKH